MTTWVERANERAKALGITDTRIAAHCGVSRPTVSNWMNGKREPRLEQKMQLAEALQISLNWLETGEEGLPDKHLPTISMDDISALLREYDEKKQMFKTIASSAIQIMETDSKRSFLVQLDNDTMIDPLRGDIRHIPEGATVQIDADMPPKSGQILLIEHEGSMILRIWKKLDRNLHSLRVINPLYETLNFNYEGDINDIYRGTAVGFSQSLM
ncbi:LexA family transcriptional regulator [Endozoicomonas sp. SCSIO W0465]|uniref:LexA family transcriptional regulator n=1 Tax=Endozoicomonas sp. SCSIO W0465 TaxID=2918516 RepID=UPI0020766525|nr:LexA family transcriptional regulator [Endozoicomonas sp. SCSIO W0465]USE36403.1 helix-turn-helix domain-containing protein [Endozoicomonas sp. SCSIO W0465]